MEGEGGVRGVRVERCVGVEEEGRGAGRGGAAVAQGVSSIQLKRCGIERKQ